MRKIPFLCLAALTLVSCSPKEADLCNSYTPNPEGMVAYYIGTCFGYGHKADTPEMVECVQKQILDIRKRQDDAVRDFLNIPSVEDDSASK